MADFSIPNLGTAVVGFASTAPSTGKRISASVTNSDSSSYIFSGDISGSNPSFTIIKGDTLSLSISASGHPFWIKTSAVTGTGSSVTTGTITNNGIESGTLTWDTVGVATGTYYYICQYHSSMQGTITVSNLSYAIADNSPNPENRSISFNETRPGFLTGRRPSQGQLFPRGVYNK